MLPLPGGGIFFINFYGLWILETIFINLKSEIQVVYFSD